MSEMSDILLCHSCKVEPSTVAHFDFQYPAAVTGKTLKDLAFVGYMKMFLKSTDPILETHIDIYPVRAYSHQAKAKKIIEQLKRLKNKGQTSKKFFSFTFTRCERALTSLFFYSNL